MSIREMRGSVMTVRGPIAPESLGAVLMHEHLHADMWDGKTDRIIEEEVPSQDRHDYLMVHAVPLLHRARELGLGAFCDVTMPPWRGWPTLYRAVSEATGVHIVMSTGFYREIELGTYWATTPERAIWSRVRTDAVEALAEMCVREIVDGIHGTDIHAGAIKLGTSRAPMTDAETKAFRAGARAQIQTGVHITTHCTMVGAETSQLTTLEREGVDLRRVVIGHTAWHLKDNRYRRTVLDWMSRGANFMPTNLGIGGDGGEGWRPLVEAIHEVFAAGHGDKLTLGLDSGFCSEPGVFGPVTFLPPHPWMHMFTHTLPAFRAMGLEAAEEKAMMVDNPARILPVL